MFRKLNNFKRQSEKLPEHLQNEEGMTLLEIMIVLAILGGLIAVLATNVMSRFKKAKVEQTKVQMNQVGTALDMFYTDCGFYPEELGGLVSAPSECSNWGPDPYVKNMPRDAWGNEFEWQEKLGRHLAGLGADNVWDFIATRN